MSRTGAPATVVELGALLGGELELELGEPGGEGGGLVLGEVEGGGLVEQLLAAGSHLSRLSGGSTKSCSVTPTASTMTKRVLAVASGVTAWKSAGAMVRAPRPFICSKYCAERTSRMKNTHSSGFTSVPVAIMSTVTAIRRVGLVRNACELSLGVAWRCR